MNPLFKNKASNALLLSVITLPVAYADVNVGMEGLGDLTGDYFFSSASAVSGDGTTVVGSSQSASGNEAFRWTSAGGMVGLGDLAGGTFYSSAEDVSNDGSVVVGWSKSGSGPAAEAFRWTEAGGMVGLGDLAGGNFASWAWGVSGDGSVVVGYSMSGNGQEAFRWTEAGGMVGLGDLAGGSFVSIAYGTNDDGSVVVGYSISDLGGEAFRWTEAGGMVGLGDLAGGIYYSTANAVSGDGSVVVGNSNTDLGSEAFRWTESSGMVGLGVLSGNSQSYAYGVNGDGSVVVGYSEDADEVLTAFRWSETAGMQSLAEWLADSGYTLTGWSDTVAYGVSDDGNIVVGSATNADGYTEAFIARGGSGLIGTTNFTESLQSAGEVVTQGVGQAQTILHGAHGHPGANRALDDQSYFWVAGDLGGDNRHNSDDDFGLGEVGFGYRFDQNLGASAAIGKLWSDSHLQDAGHSDSRGTYLALDSDIRLPVKLPLYATLTYLYGKNDMDIRRGYLNSGNLDASNGQTDQTFQALRARLQWQDAYQQERFALHPYLEFNAVHAKTDAFTETGGGFPVSYDAQTETVRDGRVGSDLNYRINDRTRFLGTFEAVHRLDSQGQGVNGQVIGLSSFALAGREYDQNWLRATAGIEHDLKAGRLTLTLNASSEGEDPTWWGGINFSKSF